MSALQKIQSELNAPKGQRNKFGKYNYRSCEDILEALKPLLAANDCSLIINDDVVEIAGRVYIKATCTLLDADNKAVQTSQAFARESLTKKGMDDSQITGSTSSYARKYALNGLFLIDDNKDADSNEQKQQSDNAPVYKTAPKASNDDLDAVVLDLCGNINASTADKLEQHIQAARDWSKANGGYGSVKFKECIDRRKVAA